MSSTITQESALTNFDLEKIKNEIFEKMLPILPDDLLSRIVYILDEFLYKELSCLLDKCCSLETSLTFAQFSCDILNQENAELKLKQDKNIPTSDDKYSQTEDIAKNENQEIISPVNKEIEETSIAPWTGVIDFQKEVEQVASSATDYFDEQSGMYYDEASKYYYCPNSGLYYDYKTGIYFYYNYELEKYEFHSQVSVNEKTDLDDEQVKSPKSTSSLEEGEYESDVEPSPLSPYPLTTAPCLRLIVKEGELKGQLFIVTIAGGTVGSIEGQDVLLNCNSVSRKHALISYISDYPDDHHFYIKDNGSTNGTYVQGNLLSHSDDTEPTEVGHGWELRCGDVVLGCHIHPGNNTCNECEPGIIASNKEKKKEVVKFDKEKERRRQVRKLKKKVGLSLPPIKPDKCSATKYQDRASERRAIVGSDNPYEKTDMASITEEIREDNVGYKMLKKMGWEKGDGLGVTGEGRKEPVVPRVVERQPEKSKRSKNSGSTFRKKIFVKATND